jgi:hypothetical protein
VPSFDPTHLHGSANRIQVAQVVAASDNSGWQVTSVQERLEHMTGDAYAGASRALIMKGPTIMVEESESFRMERPDTTQTWASALRPAMIRAIRTYASRKSTMNERSNQCQRNHMVADECHFVYTPAMYMNHCSTSNNCGT